MQAQLPSAAPTAPTPPAVPAIASGPATTTAGTAGPADIYRALKAQRRELQDQLESLEGKRQEATSRLEDRTGSDIGRKGIEQRIGDIDQRITTVESQLAASDAQIAQAAAVPGATVEPAPIPRPGPPEEVFILSGMFIMVVFLPLSIAYARRIWRRGATVISTLPRELGERLTRLEQAVDSIGVEVERIGEGQRFVTRVMTENSEARALGAGAARPIDVKAREHAPHVRL